MFLTSAVPQATPQRQIRGRARELTTIVPPPLPFVEPFIPLPSPSITIITLSALRPCFGDEHRHLAPEAWNTIMSQYCCPILLLNKQLQAKVTGMVHECWTVNKKLSCRVSRNLIHVDLPTSRASSVSGHFLSHTSLVPSKTYLPF